MKEKIYMCFELVSRPAAAAVCQITVSIFAHRCYTLITAARRAEFRRTWSGADNHLTAHTAPWQSFLGLQFARSLVNPHSADQGNISSSTFISLLYKTFRLFFLPAEGGWKWIFIPQPIGWKFRRGWIHNRFAFFYAFVVKIECRWSVNSQSLAWRKWGWGSHVKLFEWFDF